MVQERFFIAFVLFTHIVQAILSIILTERFGDLINNGNLATEDDQDRLSGNYAIGLVSTSGITTGISFIYLIIELYEYTRIARLPNVGFSNDKMKKSLIKLLILFSMIIAVILGVLVIYFTEHYQSIDEIDLSPVPVDNQNYHLRGSYGKALLSMSVISLFFSITSQYALQKYV